MDNIDTKLYIGIVEDVVDDLMRGRIKIRVFGVYDNVKTEDLPYASPYTSPSGKSFSVPALGKVVNVTFPNGSKYEPYYIYSENYNIILEDKLKEMDQETYESFNSIVIDEISEIYTTKNLLKIKQLKNQITIDNNSINLELKDNNRHVNIGTTNATQQAVLGNNWFEWFDKFINALQKPTSLVGNMSAPIIKPEIDMLLMEYKQLRGTFVSNHVNIVDNNSVKKIKD